MTEEISTNSEPIIEGEDEDQEEKDSSVHSFTLSSGCSWPNAVKWSFDGRIAILTDSVIHVIVSFRSLLSFSLKTIFLAQEDCFWASYHWPLKRFYCLKKFN